MPEMPQPGARPYGVSDSMTAAAQPLQPLSPLPEAARAPVLSLVVPVYNEGPHLRAWCEYMLSLDFGVTTEFVFVDDCSTDDSRAILAENAQRPNVRVFLQDQNRGKGAAVARGIQETKGDIVLIQDADFEYSPKDIPAVIAPILENEADVVFGSRYRNSRTVHRTLHYAGNRLLTMFSNIASGLYVTDMETCYKAFRGEIIRAIEIESPRFGVEPELTAKVAALKVRVNEVPIRYSPRTYLEGKKIGWKDGVSALWCIVRFNAQQKKLHEALARVPAQYKVKGRQWL